jgi:hypothetical protein
MAMPIGIAAKGDIRPTIYGLEGESMKARHWMQIAALTSALGLAGAATAQNTDATTTTDSSSVSSYGMDTPSAGAIVTPADKAAGMGKPDRASSPNGDVDEDTSASSPSNGDTLSVNPGPSNDEDSSVSPPSNDDEISVNPSNLDRDDNATRYGTRSPSGSMIEHDRTSRLDEDRSAPARIGSDVRPGDMGPADVRGE